MQQALVDRKLIDGAPAYVMRADMEQDMNWSICYHISYVRADMIKIVQIFNEQQRLRTKC